MQPKNDAFIKVMGFSYFICQILSNQLHLDRQREGDGTTRAAIVSRCYRSAHELNEFFHQSQADAGSAGGAGKEITTR